MENSSPTISPASMKNLIETRWHERCMSTPSENVRSVVPDLRLNHILLAEDNPTDVMLVELALKEHAIECKLLVMRDGAEALRFFRDLDGDSNAHAPDLVLLDLHLPKHGGEEITRQVRTSQRCSGTPLVVMSSSDSPKDRADAARHNARYFRKPLSIDGFMELGAIVRDALMK